ncbi:unnamed protein product [Bursaphelenchus xylophilus]|uniref:(pine wood nematode) hypothetical protein n=1 Tax=Bursaphelenchus xylophilus TaxID=6326 RepID=A0A1I7SFY2_BURXY|nr:unnamed protein product [Bursaphelenchus xylophilus]CAG9120929.1 unnamed protein product [Bursaphelenchus xylophilus]
MWHLSRRFPINRVFPPQNEFEYGVDRDADLLLTGGDFASSPHRMLYTQIRADDATPEINSWRILGLSVVLSLTCMLFIFYVLKLIWTKFGVNPSEAEDLIPESPSEETLIEETEFCYGTIP